MRRTRGKKYISLNLRASIPTTHIRADRRPIENDAAITWRFQHIDKCCTFQSPHVTKLQITLSLCRFAPKSLNTPDPHTLRDTGIPHRPYNAIIIRRADMRPPALGVPTDITRRKQRRRDHVARSARVSYESQARAAGARNSGSSGKRPDG